MSLTQTIAGCRVINRREPQKRKAPGTFGILVKTELMLRNWTVSDLADRIGVRRETVSRAISGSRTYPKIELQIRMELFRNP